MSTEVTAIYEYMAYPTIHIINPSKVVLKRSFTYLHDILASVYTEGYSYTIQTQDEDIYVFLERRKRIDTNIDK